MYSYNNFFLVVFISDFFPISYLLLVFSVLLSGIFENYSNPVDFKVTFNLYILKHGIFIILTFGTFILNYI
jgi:hypothetical protein